MDNQNNKLIDCLREREGLDTDPDIVEICEINLAVPSFRTRTRLVAKLTPAFWGGSSEDKHKVNFELQYQHKGEPGHWLPDPSFPWHTQNLDSIIKAIIRNRTKIEALL
jgi:hypothetical protein